MKKISHIKLLELLKNHPISFKINSHEHITHLFENDELVCSNWLNDNKNFDWHGKPLYKDACTYSDCRFIEVLVKNNQIIVNLIIWDGDSFYGTATNKRCEFLFNIDKKSPIIKLIKSKLMGELYYLAKGEYLLMKEIREKNEINEILANMLA